MSQEPELALFELREEQEATSYTTQSRFCELPHVRQAAVAPESKIVAQLSRALFSRATLRRTVLLVLIDTDLHTFRSEWIRSPRKKVGTV